MHILFLEYTVLIAMIFPFLDMIYAGLSLCLSMKKRTLELLKEENEGL